jgi:hypothetical protein
MAVIALALALAVGALLYRWLLHKHLGHSALMFLGIPTVLAILLALTPRAETVTGAILRGITLALLIVAPVLGEGYLCILVASHLGWALAGAALRLPGVWQSVQLLMDASGLGPRDLSKSSERKILPDAFGPHVE